MMQSMGWVCGVSVVLLLSAAPPVAAYEVDKRGKVLLASVADYEKCLGDAPYGSEQCLEGAALYAKTHPKDGFGLGKATRAGFTHWVALQFFAPALENAPPSLCADPDLGMAVVSGLALPDDNPNTAVARKIADGPCWEGLLPALKAELKEPGAYFKQNTCPLFGKRGLQAPECATEKVKVVAPPLRSGKLASLDVRGLSTEPTTAQAFRGRDNEQVFLVKAKPPHADVVLLKLKGFHGPWNNTIVPAVESEQRSGIDYVALIEGREWLILRMRNDAYTLYPKGYTDGVYVVRESLAEPRSKPLDANSVLKEFSFAPPAHKP